MSRRSGARQRALREGGLSCFAHAVDIADPARFPIRAARPRSSNHIRIIGPDPAFLNGVRDDAKRFVYVLESTVDARRHYIGLTCDVAGRLAAHNAGLSSHTSKYRPWRMLVAMEFTSEQAAIRFEKYLKSGSGRAFSRRHFT